MYLPRLSETAATRNMIRQFKGYNHTDDVGEDQFYDMKNMTSSCYPLAASRNRRGIIRTFEKPNGLFAKEKLCWVDGTKLYYNGEYIGEVEDSVKQFVSMGAYLLIWPDKKYLDTKTLELKDLGATFVTTTTASFTLCKQDGTDYGTYDVGDTPPDEPADGDLWVDTSDTVHVLKQYSGYSASWISVPTTYIKIVSSNIGKNFKKHDGVTISGCNKEALNADFILYECKEDFIVVTGILDAVFSQEEPITVERKIPDMDFLTESENRVWGCSSDKHEIYACKLGDPTNWNCFMGIASDSYALTVGSDGDFTGACTHLGYVLFFKEDVIHKVNGSKPANYQITNTHVRGVQRGSEKSLAIVNETLYYKAKHGVCAYEGALPQAISEVFGQEAYHSAVAGTIGNRYYICMEDRDGTWHLFVYDEAYDTWHREDNTHATYFAQVGNELFYIDASDNSLRAVNGSTQLYVGDPQPGQLEEPVAWYAETGNIGIDLVDHKYISKIQVRFEIDEEASAKIEVQYDSSGEWEEVYSLTSAANRAYTAPILPRRCDHMKMRFSGIGPAKIFSISKVIEQGSEI